MYAQLWSASNPRFRAQDKRRGTGRPSVRLCAGDALFGERSFQACAFECAHAGRGPGDGIGARVPAHEDDFKTETWEEVCIEYAHVPRSHTHPSKDLMTNTEGYKWCGQGTKSIPCWASSSLLASCANCSCGKESRFQEAYDEVERQRSVDFERGEPTPNPNDSRGSATPHSRPLGVR